MNKLRVGIIGLGGIAKSHCSAIAELDSVEVVAVADFFEEKQRQYMDQYNIAKGYNTHTELLEDPEVDAVAITLGHQLHHRAAHTLSTDHDHPDALTSTPILLNAYNGFLTGHHSTALHRGCFCG